MTYPSNAAKNIVRATLTAHKKLPYEEGTAAVRCACGYVQDRETRSRLAAWRKHLANVTVIALTEVLDLQYKESK